MPDLLHNTTGLKAKTLDTALHLFDLAAYEFLYRFSPAKSTKFFNGGYLPLAKDMINLEEFHEEPHSVMMYHLIAASLISEFNPKPKSIIDIGCGQGGGVRYIHELYKKANIIGIDRNSTVVRLANKNYSYIEHIKFESSSSDELIYPDETFDMVLSVGAPTYFGLKEFVSVANRICKPNGIIAFSGGYRQGNHEKIQTELEQAAKTNNLSFESYHNITPHTFASLKADLPRREKLLKKVPWPFRLYGEKWADMPGSTEYEEYETGKRADFACVLTKPA